MRNQNVRAGLQQTKQSTGNRLEWGAHNPNLKAHHVIHTTYKRTSEQTEWFADRADDNSIEDQIDFKR